LPSSQVEVRLVASKDLRELDAAEPDGDFANRGTSVVAVGVL